MLFIARILLFLSFFSLLSRLLFGLLGLTQQDDSLMTATVWCVSGWLSFWQGPLYQAFLQQLAHMGGSTWLPPEGRVMLPFINGASGNYNGSEVDLSALLGLGACCVAAGGFRILETTLELVSTLYLKLRPLLLRLWFRKRRQGDRNLPLSNVPIALNRATDRPPDAQGQLLQGSDISANPLPSPLVSPGFLPGQGQENLFVFQPGPYQANLFHSQFYQEGINRFQQTPFQPGTLSRGFQNGQLPHIVSPRASILLPGKNEPPPWPQPP